MVQGIDEAGELDQPAGGQAVLAPIRPTIGPGDGDGHPSGRASLAHEDDIGARAAPLQDDVESLPGQRVERMDDDDRVRNQARTGRPGLMRGPWRSRAGAACRRPWGSCAPAREGAETSGL